MLVGLELMKKKMKMTKMLSGLSNAGCFRITIKLLHHILPPFQISTNIYLIDLHTLLPVAFCVGAVDLDPIVIENHCLIWPSFSPDSRFVLVGSGDGSLLIFNLDQVENYRGLDQPLQSLVTLQEIFSDSSSPFQSLLPPPFFSLSPRRVQQKKERRKRILRLAPSAILKGHTSLVNSVAIDPQFRFLVTVSDDFNVCVWGL